MDAPTCLWRAPRLGRASASLAGALARCRHARRSGTRWESGAPTARLGGPGDPGADRTVGDRWTVLIASSPIAAPIRARCSSPPRRCAEWPRSTRSACPSPPSTRRPPPWPDFVSWKPNRIWIWDATHFTRARRVALAIMDVVSRRWIEFLVSAEESSTQVQLLFSDALQSEGLLDKLTPERLDLAVDDPAPTDPSRMV